MTPGPWHVEFYTDFHAIKDSNGDFVCSTWGGPEEENAHLIAAAPDLYASLHELLLYLDEHNWGTIPEGATADRARAAIAKAQGKP